MLELEWIGDLDGDAACVAVTDAHARVLQAQAEEFYAVDVNVTLTMFATLLGLLPVMLGGTPEQRRRFLKRIDTISA